MAANLTLQEPRGGMTQAQTSVGVQQSLLGSSKLLYKKELELQKQEKDRMTQEAMKEKRTDMLASKQMEEALQRFDKESKAQQQLNKKKRSQEIQRQIQEKKQVSEAMFTTQKESEKAWVEQLQREEAELQQRKKLEKIQKIQEEIRLLQLKETQNELQKNLKNFEKAEDKRRAQRYIEAANERELKLQLVKEQKSREVDQKTQAFAAVNDKEKDKEKRKDQLINRWAEDRNQIMEYKHICEEKMKAQQSHELYQALAQQRQEVQARKEQEKRIKEEEKAMMNNMIQQTKDALEHTRMQRSFNQTSYRNELGQQLIAKNPAHTVNSSFGTVNNTQASLQNSFYHSAGRNSKSTDFMMKINLDRHNPIVNPIGELQNRTSFAKGKGISLLKAGNSISRY